jgi:hypothetical protein
LIQIYLLSLVYILLGSGLLLVERYGGDLLFLIDIKNSLYRNRLWQMLLIPSGIALFFALLFSPVDPGPIILGDLLPAITVLALVIHYLLSVPGKTLASKIRRLFSRNPEDDDFPSDKADQVLASTVGLEDIDQRFGGHSKLRRFLGWVCLVTAILHFVFPSFVLI